MTLLMNKEEMKLFNNFISTITEEPIESNEIIKKGFDKDSGLYYIDMNEEYITAYYQQFNKWLPTIVNTIKTLVTSIKSAYKDIDKATSEAFHNILLKKKTEEVNAITK